MPSRGLLDDVLVAVARSVRRWTDRVLAEYAHETSAVSQLDHASPDEDSESFDDDGPPEHWLEMVRARAPHLLPPGYRRRRVASLTADGIDEGMNEGMNEQTADGIDEGMDEGMNAQMNAQTAEEPNEGMDGGRAASARDSMATDIVRTERAPPWERDPEELRARSVPAAAEVARSRSGESTAPASLARAHEDLPRHPTREPAAPALVPAPPPTMKVSSPASQVPARRTADSDQRVDVPRAAGQTHWHEDAAPAHRETAAGQLRRRHDTPTPSETTAPSEQPARPVRGRRDATASAREAADSSMRWHRDPDRARNEATASSLRRRDDAPARERRDPAPAARETAQAPTRWRDDDAQAPHAEVQPAAPQRETRRDEPAPARSERLALELPPVLHGPRSATSALVRPPDARTAPAHESVPGGQPRAWGAAPAPTAARVPTTMADASAWDAPGFADLGALPSPSPSFEGAGDRQHARSAPSMMSAALWPRLPDEDDDDGRGSPARSDVLPWPELPVDDMSVAAEPSPGDHEREDRLRREQRGMRWSERRS